MIRKETDEGNILIAEFMGAQPNSEKDFFYFPTPINRGFLIRSLKYHSDWNLLMGVVEKINKFGDTGVLISPSVINVWGDTEGKSVRKPLVQIVVKESLIDSVWLAVIGFINWYNSNNNHG